MSHTFKVRQMVRLTTPQSRIGRALPVFMRWCGLCRPTRAANFRIGSSPVRLNGPSARAKSGAPRQDGSRSTIGRSAEKG